MLVILSVKSSEQLYPIICLSIFFNQLVTNLTEEQWCNKVLSKFRNLSGDSFVKCLQTSVGSEKVPGWLKGTNVLPQ